MADKKLDLLNALLNAFDQHEAVLIKLIETIPTGVTILDKDGKIKYANPTAESMLGLVRTEIEARVYNDPQWKIGAVDGGPFPDEDLPFNRVIETGEAVYDIEHAIEHPDGRQVFLSINAAPIFDDSKELTGVVATLNDITEQHKAESELKLSVQRYHELVDRISSGVAVYHSDDGEEFIIKDFNQAAEQIEGVKRDQIINKRLTDVFYGVKQFGLFEVLQRVWATGKPEYFPISFYEDERVSGWRENYVYLLPENIVVAVYNDVTERKQAEQELRISEAKYRDLVENLNDTVYSLDLEGNVTYVSPQVERLLGFKPGQLIGKPFYHYASKKDSFEFNKIFKETIEKGSNDTQIRVINKNRELIWVRNSSHKIVRDGQIIGITGVMANVSEKKRIEQERDRLFNYAMDLMCVADLNGRFIQLNPAWEKTLGWALDELLNQPYIELVHPDDLESTHSVETQMQNGIPLMGFENRYLCKDGSYKWISWNSYPLVEEGMIFAVARDVTEQKKARENIERQVNRLTALGEIDRAVTNNYDLNITLRVILEQVNQQLGVDASAVFLFDPILNRLNLTAQRGFKNPFLEDVNLRLGEDMAGQVALEKRIQVVPDLARLDNPFAKTDLLKTEPFISYIGVPLISKGHVKGVLEVFQYSEIDVDEDFLTFLNTLAGQATIAIDSNELFEGLQRRNMDLIIAYDHTIEGWARALNLRGREPEGHLERVMELTLRLAETMEIDPAEMVHIRRGVLLHDIGMLGVPDAILFKPGQLTDEETQIIQEHLQAAYDTLSPIEFLRPALEIPFCHHEKWDGTGYPRRLIGEQIPIAARIFAVVDVWDALNTDRPFRKAWSHEDTLAHIKEQSGKHFDPRVVQEFLNILNK